MAKKKSASGSSSLKINYNARAEAAQREYKPPVAALLEFGEVEWKKWADYRALDFGEGDVPELIRLACDHRLDYAELAPVWSAPIHAMRVLARRGQPEFLPALFESLVPREEYDFFREELAPVIAAVGLPALPAIQAFWASPLASPSDCACLAEGLVKLAGQNRAARERIIGVFQGELVRFEENEPEWNGFLIADLMDLAAGETLPLIERAMNAGKVDEMICGGIQEVRAEFGLAPPRCDHGPLF